MKNTIVCTLLLFFFVLVVHANDVNRRRLLSSAFGGKQLRSEQQLSDIQFQYFTQVLDHFSTSSDIAESQTFQQRYVVNATLWRQPTGPVFLIIGGEGPASVSDVISGEVVELARENEALLFSLEHRFYGGSVPFDRLNASTLAYLNVEQALADLAYFQRSMSQAYNLTEQNRWFVFGCSYSGALSAWYRLKYPQLAFASSSSSSPVEAELSFYQYDQVVAATLGDTCADRIRNATATIENSLAQYKDSFGCTGTSDVGFLYALADMVAFAVQYNTSFGLVPALCKNFTTIEDPVAAYQGYVSFMLNMLNQSCVQWDISQFISDTVGVNDNMRQWMWQSCNELGYFQTAPAVNSLRSTQITAEWHISICGSLFNESMYPRTEWTNTNYGGARIVTSDTIFTNGGADPWRMLSVTKDLGTTVPAIVIEGEAHCSNWYAPKPKDTSYLINGRKLASSYIRAFLSSCVNDCNNQGVCMTRKTGDTKVSAKCVCYEGFTGDACQSKLPDNVKKVKEVAWWAIVVAGLACLIVGATVGWVSGRKYVKSKDYSTI